MFFFSFILLKLLVETSGVKDVKIRFFFCIDKTLIWFLFDRQNYSLSLSLYLVFFYNFCNQ